ncbi:MAG: hypothetical protein ACRDJI_05855 [Actinomycetota bacterium]
MRKLVIAGVITGMTVLPGAGEAAVGGGFSVMPPESCQAFNPGQPMCSFTATSASATPVSGIAGAGSWVVIVKRGKLKTVYKSPAGGEPTAVGFDIAPGDKITAKALTPGSGLIVGHSSP